MPRRMKKVFESCGKAVRVTLANGRSTPAQLKSIKLGRLILLGIIGDLACGRVKFRDPIDRAMRDLHPRTEFCTAMTIRDIADVCVTLDRLEQNRRRDDRTKLLEAALLCEFLTDEFKAASMAH